MFFQAEGTFALPTPTTSIHYGPPYGLTYQFNILLLGMFRIIDKKKVKLFCGISFFLLNLVVSAKSSSGAGGRPTSFSQRSEGCASHLVLYNFRNSFQCIALQSQTSRLNQVSFHRTPPKPTPLNILYLSTFW